MTSFFVYDARIKEERPSLISDYEEALALLPHVAIPLEESVIRQAFHDARAFLDKWGAIAWETGYLAGDLFDIPQKGFQTGGLIWSINGGTVTDIDQKSVTIRHKDGVLRTHYFGQCR